MIGVLNVDEVGPLEDFGKAELVQGVDNRIDGRPRADDQNFDGFAIGFGVGVELEGEFNTDGLGQIIGGRQKGLGLHGRCQPLGRLADANRPLGRLSTTGTFEAG